MSKPLILNEDRLFSADPAQRAVARELYALIKDYPILSPHGHTDPQWFADNANFGSATELFLAPDHYIYRMLYSQGYDLNDLGVGSKAGPSTADPRTAWKIFAANQHLFRGTPTAMWMNHVFGHIMGFDKRLDETTADAYFDRIGELLASDAYKPRALFERFNIELLATTESPTDTLEHHQKIRASGWKGRVVTAYRPDPVIDAEHEDFRDKLKVFAELSGEDVYSWKGYLAAHRKRRDFFMEMGATSTDHGHPTAKTANLSASESEALFNRIIVGEFTPADAELFRAQMLTEMARMSLDDGLTMQIHPGSFRNHNQTIFETFGRDKGCDIPLATDYVNDLKPLLDAFGNEKTLTVILFTLDETSYSRELAPLAGHYPILKLGPSWWFHDSPEGMTRFREQVTETAGFYNTVGFNDDTRAFLSIPARHDVARRIDANFLARLVVEHRLELEDAAETIKDLTYNLPKAAYKL
ncbi:glucuronate isomerase [Asticcacaulis excentricus]|uniref:Uronate isomerase n=1 Tax=Asticcacaulis excentricus TaxID=78587 RepID=A0A3G9G9E2_9CAUL|nr:glucuronate isomerase [Asticcacaulis excentricus]BBF80978.1 uronate isomerase [Asticcacaulis excentricus]